MIKKSEQSNAFRPFSKHVRYLLCILWGCFILLWGGVDIANAATVDCQANRPDAGNIIYLYYPTASDSDFPDDVGGVGVTTSPLAEFDVSDLDGGIGTTADLRSAITELVKRDYCEFDVQIIQATSGNGTTNPTPSDSRWQVVGIGSDAQTVFGGNLFGIAEDVDMGDNNLTDFSRVFADSFNSAFGGSGQALGGANSTFERWANAIAGTVSHEAGHNYGVAHEDSAPQPTEDPQSEHLLATGMTGLTGEDRVEERHFSDTSVEILAANIGLFEQTVSNWDFVNPNDSAADGFEITVLVLPSDGTPSAGSIYTGGLSPWEDVAISADGTENFKGTNYSRFTIAFVSPKSWNNGPDGQVPAGEEFHVGVGLTTDYIVRDTSLTSGGSELELNPRVVGYTTGGSFDPSTGDFHVTFSNPDPENGPLFLSDFLIRYIPRTVDINEMIPGGQLLGIDGLSVNPWNVRVTDQDSFEVVDKTDVTLGNLAEDRAVNFLREPKSECGIIGPPPEGDMAFPFTIEYCPEGQVLGLFPSARVYFEATLTDPDARYFDPMLQRFVEGPLESKIFVQLPGVKPDLNDNGVDDAIDIDTGACKDINQNGVCDEAEPRFKYASKLICGLQKDLKNMRLAQGFYATAINVLNPNDRKAKFTGTLSLTFPSDARRPGKVLSLGKYELAPYEAIEVDCIDIHHQLFPTGLPAPYIKGFVTLKSDKSLDVTSVYTAKGLKQKQKCHRKHEKSPFYDRKCHKDHYGWTDSCCKKRSTYCKKQPQHYDCENISHTTISIDVETIPERKIPLRLPPEAKLPDLVVSAIGFPRVQCSQGTCVTKVDVVISNIGTEDANPFNTKVVLDPSQSVTFDQAFPSGLLAGASQTFTVTTAPNGNCFDPNCTICVTVDNLDEISESNENNNNLCSTTPG